MFALKICLSKICRMLVKIDCFLNRLSLITQKMCHYFSTEKIRILNVFIWFPLKFNFAFLNFEKWDRFDLDRVNFWHGAKMIFLSIWLSPFPRRVELHFPKYIRAYYIRTSFLLMKENESIKNRILPLYYSDSFFKDFEPFWTIKPIFEYGISYIGC